MNTYKDRQLKRALAKMLPEDIFVYGMSKLTFYWAKDYTGTTIDGGARVVLDTELLHLCWLVEEQLTMGGLTAMAGELHTTHAPKEGCHDASAWKFHKSWQQRVIALAKVKEVEIV